MVVDNQIQIMWLILNWGIKSKVSKCKCGWVLTQANSSSYGEDGYVLLTGYTYICFCNNIQQLLYQHAFTASSVPTTSRIVVFEENVDTPTLNTDIIASISRDGGSTFHYCNFKSDSQDMSQEVQVDKEF